MVSVTQRASAPLANDLFDQTEGPPRGFLSQVGLVLLQPGEFFRNLARGAASRQWLWAAALILALIAFSAIQQGAAAAGAAEVPIVEMGMGGPPIDGPIDGPFPPGGGPPPPDGGGAPVDSAGGDPASTWTVGLTAAGRLVIAWGVLALLLSEVSLFNGRLPKLGRNVQIVIWASLPLALMAGLQILFMSAGGTLGAPGLTGFLPEIDAYTQLDLLPASMLHGLASLVTLFSLWSLFLLYMGARLTLNGKPWAVILVMVLWVALLTGIQGFDHYQANRPGPTLPEPLVPGDVMPGEMMPGEMMPGEVMPGEMMPGEVVPEDTGMTEELPRPEGPPEGTSGGQGRSSFAPGGGSS